MCSTLSNSLTTYNVRERREVSFISTTYSPIKLQLIFSFAQKWKTDWLIGVLFTGFFPSIFLLLIIVCEARPFYPLPSKVDNTNRLPLQTSRPYNIAHRGSNGEIPEETALAYMVKFIYSCGHRKKKKKPERFFYKLDWGM